MGERRSEVARRTVRSAILEEITRATAVQATASVAARRRDGPMTDPDSVP
jgi:hypothetical protein